MDDIDLELLLDKFDTITGIFIGILFTALGIIFTINSPNYCTDSFLMQLKGIVGIVFIFSGIVLCIAKIKKHENEKKRS